MVRARAFAPALYMAVVASVASAQVAAGSPDATPNGNVRRELAGTVLDSIHGGALSGARITLLGTSREATSAADGSFRFDTLAAGTYTLEVAHPLLDTLGMDGTSGSISLRNTRVIVGFSTPSRSTIRRVLCGRADSVRTPGLIVGRIRDADTGAPAAGAVVSLAYPELTVSKTAGVHRLWRVRKATVTGDGKYSICGLPARLNGTLLVTRGADATAEVKVTLDDGAFALRSMTIGSLSSSAVLTGRVVNAAGEPVSGAEALLTGSTAMVRTSANGEFSLQSQPSGTRELVVRTVGYEPTTMPVELTPREPRNVVVKLASLTPMLPRVQVEGIVETGLKRAGFLDRKAMGMGYFVTPAMIDSMRPRALSDLLSNAPGIQVSTGDWGTQVQATRVVQLMADACVNVFVDRAPWSSIMAGDMDSAFPVADIVAIEVYGGTGVPSEFTVPGKNCATVVVWTKTSIGRK